ncbi:unnamed protein product [Nezara viridula]|uniref:Uncharacterized protein n=1 Tax=Nezara viridula TaxID=85310 RepID=A0A9P0HCQ0_NEZVI|nr:unnamed protein product [Nezara viridula]
MADDIVSAMEQEMVEEQAIMCPMTSAKRQRKGSPDSLEESDKERVDLSLLQDTRRIIENIRVYMNATDRNVTAKVNMDTLASSEIYDVILNALVRKAASLVIEGIKTEWKTIQRPLPKPQTSREFPSVREKP